MNHPTSYPPLASLPHLAFNLGGGYNAKGQQCAAALVAPNLVYFVDIARGLDYFFACDLSVRMIREDYLYNRKVFVPYADGQCELRAELEKLAATAPSL
jgi:hypothetical protein